MGFFLTKPQASQTSIKGMSVDFLHRHGCQVCPLNGQPGLKHPNMQPFGTSKPLVYILGEGPGETEDKKGRPFVGKAGQVLRFRIPENWLDKIRWNNVVRTRPPNNREPTPVEVECCRKSIEKDIEDTKPNAIFGFGNIPLEWATKETGITRWCGRKIPVKVGSHSCWFFPIIHPSAILRNRKFTPSTIDKYGSDEEFRFALDLKTAFAAVEAGLPSPKVHTVNDALSDIEVVRDWRRAIELIKSMYDESIVGFDYETKGKRPYGHPRGKTNVKWEESKILTAALAGKNLSFAFPLYHQENKWTDAQLNKVQDAFEGFLYEYKGIKTSHFLTFEMEWSGFFYGPKVIRAGKWGDTVSQAYVIDERQNMHSLEILVLQHFGINIKEIDNLDKDNLDNESLDHVLRYNGLDAKYHRKLFLAQEKRIKELGLEELYQHQLARVPTMVLTQLKGIPVDQEVVKEFHGKYSDILEDIKSDISQVKEVKQFEHIKGKEFNPGSNPDVKWLVNNILKVPINETDESELKQIKHPIAGLILEYRGIAKLHSTYVKPCLPGSPVLYPDGLLHPIISVARTATWRTSSDGPNSQNWPKHAEAGTQD